MRYTASGITRSLASFPTKVRAVSVTRSGVRLFQITNRAVLGSLDAFLIADLEDGS